MSYRDVDSMQKIIDLIKEGTGTTSNGIAWAMFIVGCLIVIFGLIGIFISIFLWLKYHNLNKKYHFYFQTIELVLMELLKLQKHSE